MMGWGPAASTLKDMPVRTQYARSLASRKHELGLNKDSTSRPMYFAQSLQVNPPNPAVCHGTLRLPLRGG